MLGVHAVNDSVALVAREAQFRRAMQVAGQGDRWVQTFTDDNEHSYWGDPVYPALINALAAWTQQGSSRRHSAWRRAAWRCSCGSARAADFYLISSRPVWTAGWCRASARKNHDRASERDLAPLPTI